jgi:hypothetical protein
MAEDMSYAYCDGMAASRPHTNWWEVHGGDRIKNSKPFPETAIELTTTDLTKVVYPGSADTARLFGKTTLGVPFNISLKPYENRGFDLIDCSAGFQVGRNIEHLCKATPVVKSPVK